MPDPDPLPEPPAPDVPGYPARAAQWVLHHGGLPQLMLEVPAVEAYPRGLARASWMVCSAVAAGREAGAADGPLGVGAVVPGAALADMLPGEVALLLRSARVDTATMEGTAGLRRRMELLARVGPVLPLEWAPWG